MLQGCNRCRVTEKLDRALLTTYPLQHNPAGTSFSRRNTISWKGIRSFPHSSSPHETSVGRLEPFSKEEKAGAFDALNRSLAARCGRAQAAPTPVVCCVSEWHQRPFRPVQRTDRDTTPSRRPLRHASSAQVGAGPSLPGHSSDGGYRIHLVPAHRKTYGQQGSVPGTPSGS